MKKLLVLFLIALCCSTQAQFTNSPYKDHSGETFDLPTAVPPTYDGEYQIFMDNYFWDIDGSGVTAFVRIEAVSFPFAPPLRFPLPLLG